MVQIYIIFFFFYSFYYVFFKTSFSTSRAYSSRNYIIIKISIILKFVI